MADAFRSRWTHWRLYLAALVLVAIHIPPSHTSLHSSASVSSPTSFCQPPSPCLPIITTLLANTTLSVLSRPRRDYGVPRD